VNVPLWAWMAFVGFILVMLAVDLVAHRHAHVVSTREAAIWSAVWVALGLAFAGALWAWQGATAAGQYLAGFLIEKSLAVDNIFVFALLFTYFAVPRQYRHRVLFYGVLGALVFRAAFIAAGASLLETFHVTIYVFGAFLVLTGVKMARSRDHEVHPDRNPVLRLVRRALPMTDRYHGQRFWVRQGARWVATPLFAVLVAVETTDVIFAVDSIPAIFAVTSEPFLVFTSNAFAILGLRALYFLLEGMIHRFTYLKLGLSAVLVFVGAKMLASDLYKVNTWVSLGVIAAIIGTSVWASLRRNNDPARAEDPTGTGGTARGPETREDGYAQTPNDRDHLSTASDPTATLARPTPHSDR
jgi:tellurite resistance protein TerC